MYFKRLIPALLLAMLGWLPAISNAVEESVFLYEGDEIKLYYFSPKETMEKPRLAILVSGGSSEYMAQAQYWIGRKMVDRGYAIALPVSAQERKYFVENADLFPSLISFIKESYEVHESKPLLLGISQGGSAALAIAGQNPTIYSGVIATPGRLWNSDEIESMEALPIYLRIGEKDSYRWNKQLPSMVNALQEAGANVDAAIVPGAKHLFELDWQNFDLWLEKVKQLDESAL